MVWWQNSTFETPYDVVMETAQVELLCHMNIYTFKQVFMAQKLETRCEKKTFILFNIQSKKRYFTKTSLYEKP